MSAGMSVGVSTGMTAGMTAEPVVLQAEKISRHYHQNGIITPALTDFSMTLRRGEIAGVIGGSGSGKTTLLRLLAGFEKPDTGTVRVTGRHMQMIFQNARASFNPRRPMRASIEAHMKRLRPLGGAGERHRETDRLLALAGVDPALADRYPREVSGGECQRIAIVRALAVEPEILLCDEITSALDVSIQAQIMELLRIIHKQTRTAILFVSHDLALAHGFCEQLYVLEDGICVEQGPTSVIFEHPEHEYTRLLLDCIWELPHLSGEKEEQHV